MSQTSYAQDFYAWLTEQAAHPRAKEWDATDIDNVAEELDTLGRSERHAVWSHLRVLLLHLLKWTYQPQRRGRSWQRSILLARQHFDRRLSDSPSLGPELPIFMAEAYTDARRLAALETNLPESTFPTTCPWNLDQQKNLDFLPEAVEEEPR
jgi:hypothetical protein